MLGVTFKNLKRIQDLGYRIVEKELEGGVTQTQILKQLPNEEEKVIATISIDSDELLCIEESNGECSRGFKRIEIKPIEGELVLRLFWG